MVAAEVIRRQHGVVSGAQLLSAGLTAAQIRSRLHRGELHRVHRNVYAVADPALLPRARMSAALIATGPCSYLSHRTAVALWGIAEDDGDQVHVLVTGGSPRRHPGLETRRVRRLDRRDVATEDNLRVTAPPRALIEFAADASVAELEGALSEARALKQVNDTSLNAALARVRPNHPGAARLRRLLASQTGRVITRSQRERALLKLLRAAGLPEPVVNQPLLGYVPDFYWPRHRLILEFDGYGTHGTRPAFESDRKRDQTFAAAGVQTIRATWLQLEHEPVALVVRIGQALAARAIRAA